MSRVHSRAESHVPVISFVGHMTAATENWFELQATAARVPKIWFLISSSITQDATPNETKGRQIIPITLTINYLFSAR